MPLWFSLKARLRLLLLAGKAIDRRQLTASLAQAESIGAKRAIGDGRTHRGYSFGRRRR